MSYVYILQSQTSGHYYIGYTKDLARRLEEHQSDLGGWTSGKGPWQLKYFEQFISNSEARKREIQLKKIRKRAYYEWLFDNGPGTKNI